MPAPETLKRRPKTDDIIGEYYRLNWLRYLELGKKISALYAAAENAERREYLSYFNEILSTHNHLIPTPPKELTARGYYEYAQQILNDLTGLAAKSFSQPGLPPVAIESADFELNYLASLTQGYGGDFKFDAEKFDPRVIWQALSDRYSADGLSSVLRAIARELRLIFQLEPGKPVEWRAGKLVLVIRAQMDTEPFDSCYCYRTYERLRAACQELSAFFNWAGYPESGRLLTAFTSRVIRSELTVRSREKITIDQSLALITYKTKIEFLLSPELAVQLQNFISEHDS